MLRRESWPRCAACEGPVKEILLLVLKCQNLQTHLKQKETNIVELTYPTVLLDFAVSGLDLRQAGSG